MAEYTSSMTRSNSTDSSALSNIDVAASALLDGASDPLSPSNERIAASTPPTSMGDTSSVSSAKKQSINGALEAVDEESGRRSKRARSGVSTYNLKKLSDAQQPEATASAASSRNVSGLTGRTLINGEEESREETPLGSNVDKALDMEWEIPEPSAAARRLSAGKLQRRPSVKDRVKKAAGKVGSVLGKRGREVMEAGKRRLGKKDVTLAEDDEENEEEEEKPRWKKELDTGPKGLLDEMDLDAEPELPPPPPAKKARTAVKEALKEMAQPPAAIAPISKASAPVNKMKRWQKEGLFVGQSPEDDGTQAGGKKKLQKKRPGSSGSDASAMTGKSNRRSFMALPMFNYLEKTRPFTIPFDVFAPSYKKGDEKPKDWHQLNRNRLVGEAKDLWEKSERLPASMCVCTTPNVRHGEQGCDDHCLNRVMQYECNDNNCNLPAYECSNRAFAELATRMKKAGPFDVGVEVVKTANRGFGVRSCRTFAPGQIIMEYTGEIISEGECQRRMRGEYKDKQCYYLMELERGLVIDGTKGSMARFINHSCEPNCEVRMVKVNGTPRMGVFAGESGVVTGEELTYDYNFDNFGNSHQICYCGAPTCRGFLSKRLNATEQKKLLKEEEGRKRKAAEEAQMHAEDEDRKKKAKTSLGSSWRGWVSVDDPETKERLKAEKREREEAAVSSSRARRLAARHGSVPAIERRPLTKKEPKRRKTAVIPKEEEEPEDVKPSTEISGGVEENGDAVEGAPAPAPVVSTSEMDEPKRSASTSLSNHTEELLPRPVSVQSTSTTITKKTEITITKTEVQNAIQQDPVPTAGNIPGPDGTSDDAPIPATAEKKRPIKDVMKSFGQAVKGGLSRSGSLNRSGSVNSNGSGNGKMKQSTLHFAKLD